MQDFEKLGTFYLGKKSDTADEELVLYDSKDLTTHAVIIGMTGSGKTGLGVGVIEEAAMDQIPVIAIDPKGDLGNLLLTFPNLAADDFKPWVDPREASEAGMTREEYAKSQAKLWEKGIGKWGQTKERISTLRQSVDMCIYTPGSSAGAPISVLQSFSAPPPQLLEDADLYRQRVQATATSVLALLDVDADPLTSREHILVSKILDHYWQDGEDLQVAGLIQAIQAPPIQQVGVVDLDSFFPSKDRFALAMKLNNLLAAPGFDVWMQGEALDVARLLHTPEGKPRISVLSIAHLSDSERMFFVSMVLNELISWMRTQAGTGSLRAVLYMDEIFGYMPPTANPPTKALLLTLLKQARAFGVGLVLSTQNPVDLDYKGLSNTGTWFIGRLQTERDMARMMEGLEGAADAAFDRQAMEKTIAGLDKRQFLLHNVHESEPVVFNTRWVMSYLAGPLTRDQIKQLMAPYKETAPNVQKASVRAPKSSTSATKATKPLLAPKVGQFFLPALTDSGEGFHYHPSVLGAAEVFWSSARYNVEKSARFVLCNEVDEDLIALDWDDAEQLDIDIDDLEKRSDSALGYAPAPSIMSNAKNYTKWEKSLKRWLRTTQAVTLYRSNEMKETSSGDESEGEFRVRLQQMGNEKRDQAVAKLRKRYASKTTTLENRLRRAEQTLEREAQQSKKKKLDVAISFGSAILGAVLGRKRISSIGSAAKSAGGIGKEIGDVRRAEQTVKAVQVELESLRQACETEVEQMSRYDAQAESLKEIKVKPKSTDVHVQTLGVLWLPFVKDETGRMHSAWD